MPRNLCFFLSFFLYSRFLEIMLLLLSLVPSPHPLFAPRVPKNFSHKPFPAGAYLSIPPLSPPRVPKNFSHRTFPAGAYSPPAPSQSCYLPACVLPCCYSPPLSPLRVPKTLPQTLPSRCLPPPLQPNPPARARVLRNVCPKPMLFYFFLYSRFLVSC